jgi:hypothetical protein
MGIENMNGGNTVMSNRHPFLSNVSPRVMFWDGEMQIHAANQNEFVYTKNWGGPFFGGFSQVIETFNDTEEPRRLKPVNIYYHFYSAVTLGSLRALEKVHDWALERPLHSMTAVDYARLIRDSYNTKIYQSAPRTWILVNQGIQKTFRVEAKQGIPDLLASSGVIGYVPYKDQLFIHTDGSHVCTLVLADAPKQRIYLESSQGEISWKALGSNKVEFSVSELRPSHTIVFGGCPAGQKWRATVNDKDSEITADAKGKLTLPLSGNAKVVLLPQ